MSERQSNQERCRAGSSCLPLTLTLSPAEREQPLVGFVKFVSRGAEAVFSFAMNKACRLTKKLGAFLPLPKGEGRGEGKETIRVSVAIIRLKSFSHPL